MAAENDKQQQQQQHQQPGRNIIELESAEERYSRQQIRNMAEVRRLRSDELEDRKIIYPGMSNRPALNAFRELRTKLMHKAGKKNFIVLVTSVSEAGGASFVSLNLAAAIAFDHSKTALLIDCNLYAPSVDNLLNIEPDYGLTDYLEDTSLDIDDIIYASGVPRLRMVPIGRHTDVGSEYFTSSRMRHFLANLRSRYADRYIVLDAPPVGQSADARILAEFCDYAILVVPYGKVTEAQIMSGVDAIDKTKLAGIVFNN